ncbi:hypothetical protein QDZ74_002508 [Pluralibacter gergoviae]|nr:hypothetical protein [Pluralibacter gergoviae]MDU4435515.1 hypothetical protein [Pluralibacter gergoviae]OUF43196.1 hypothetical protein AZ034_003854 [Pluralibacter gergoviae]OUF54971.1 hypothetical protein AZ044_001214 [Pluralibacter gergoviae]
MLYYNNTEFNSCADYAVQGRPAGKSLPASKVSQDSAERVFPSLCNGNVDSATLISEDRHSQLMGENMREMLNILLTVLPLILLLISIECLRRNMRYPRRIVTEKNGMKKISSNPSFFKRAVHEEYYYDGDFLYEIKNGVTYTIPLSTIIQIKPTSIKVNNRRKWSVLYLQAGIKREVEFFNNLTLFNHNFVAFVQAVQRINPDAMVKKPSLLNI